MSIKAELTENQIKIWEEDDAREIHDEKYYGKIMDDGTLELSLSEGMSLLEREEITLIYDENQLSKEEAHKEFSSRDSEFDEKYEVYKDLRQRGYIVKTGFKFGTHFRVYDRGVNPYEQGSKSNREHTKWVVHAVTQDNKMGYEQLSRAVRLAQNIRAKMLWGVVDSEKNVTYYETRRITP